MNKILLKKLILTGFFIALGVVLPYTVGHIPQGGMIFLPMHIPVLICGLVCGWKYGAVSGAITVIISMLIGTIPSFIMITGGVPMIFELAAYGAFAGILMQCFTNIKFNYIISLVGAMIIGRVVNAVATLLLLEVIVPIAGMNITDKFDLPGILFVFFVTGLPGIIIQLLLIPAVMFALEKAKFIPIEE